MNLFVANISRSVNDDALRALFAEYGEVTSAKIVIDKFTGESRGFGYVEMKKEQEALLALKKLTNSKFSGTTLIVSKARPKRDDPFGSNH